MTQKHSGGEQARREANPQKGEKRPRRECQLMRSCWRHGKETEIQTTIRIYFGICFAIMFSTFMWNQPLIKLESNNLLIIKDYVLCKYL